MSEIQVAISGDQLGEMLCKALGIEPARVMRIVIDCHAGPKPVSVFVEYFGDNKLLDMQWDGLLADHPIAPVEVKIEADDGRHDS